MPSLGTRSRVANHRPKRGKDTDVYIARLPEGDRTKPTDQILVVATGGAAKAATSVSLDSALTGPIEKGQYLCFYDSTGKETLARVSATANTGATSLTVDALDEAIAVGAEAEFPAYLWDRTDASIDRSYSLSAVTTFNTGDGRDGTITGNEKNFTLPGLHYHYNAAYKTALEAANEGAEVWAARVVAAPNSAFQSGDIVEGAAVVTAAPSASSQDGQVTADLTLAFLGVVTETAPSPT